MAGRGGAFPGDDDDDALPWLEPADVGDAGEDDSGFPFRGLILASAAVIGVVALLWFIAERFGTDARQVDIAGAGDEVPLIQAPEGPYKVRPENPGGLQVDDDSVTHAAAEGAAPGGTIDIGSVPEEPVPIAPPVRQVAVPAGQTAAQTPEAADVPVKRTPPPVAKVPVPAAANIAETLAPAAAPAPNPAGALTVQLGAFGTAASAEQVWSRLAGRVAALSALQRSILPVEAGGKTLYRLRASGIASAAEASAVCRQVVGAGEQCAVVR